MSSVVRTIGSDVLSVTRYASQLGSALRHVGGADLEGEVQRVQRRANGMVWFSLTDGESTLSCKVFARDAARLEHAPCDGDLVRVRVDRPDFYAAQGSLSLIVSAVSLAGEGELLRRRAGLVRQLEQEGLCDPQRRRPLPAFPRAVGVIAGAGSDGMSDVIRALVDRWPAVHIVTCASTVQGKGAPTQLIDALARLQEHPQVDVIVMARGGGSVQDLACFDDERLCRALFACATPVLCAIGHTDNIPVCNHVAWSALTPSRSAEMVVPSAAELTQSIASARRVLEAVPDHVTSVHRHLDAIAAQMNGRHAIEMHAGAVRQEGQRLTQAMRASLNRSVSGIRRAQDALTATPLRASRRLAAEHATLAAAMAALDRAADQMTDLAREIRHAGVELTRGVRRQLADHTRDYARATERLTREARTGFARRVTRTEEDLERQRVQLYQRVQRRVDDAQRGLTHHADVVSARDFRPRGWLLVSRGGSPVRSAADLSAGQAVELHLHDGRASAVINHIHESENRHG